MPARTALGVAILAMAADLELAGGDDVIAYHFGIPVEDLVWTLRGGFFVFPAIAFLLTRRICVALQRSDRRKLRRGTEYGIAVQQDGTAYTAVSRPVSAYTRAVIEAGRPDELYFAARNPELGGRISQRRSPGGGARGCNEKPARLGCGGCSSALSRSEPPDPGVTLSARSWIAESYGASASARADSTTPRCDLLACQFRSARGLVIVLGPLPLFRCSPTPDAVDRRVGAGELQAFPDDGAAGADCLCLSNLAERPAG
jgi:hypothetical protein